MKHETFSGVAKTQAESDEYEALSDKQKDKYWASVDAQESFGDGLIFHRDAMDATWY